MKCSMQKGNTLVVIIFLLANLQFTSQNYVYETKYIDMPIDHFSFASNKTFKLRYLINDTYWNTDGPVFFYTGNEGDVEVFAQNTGFMWDIAPEFEAMLVFAEHRYYGESLPFGNQSFSDPKYSGYLTSTQALADFVYLIEYLGQNNNYQGVEHRRNPVIAFGGSYGGMLASWLRMKYPASVHGAIAASAPIWQFTGLTECGVFNRIVTSVFKIVPNVHCAGAIQKSWSAIRQIASTSDGKKWLSSKLKLCNPIQNDNDVQAVVDWLTDLYGNIAMMNYPYPTNFTVPLPAHPVRSFCTQLKDISYEPQPLVEKLGKALEIVTNHTRKEKCNDISNSTPNIDAQGWYYQACTEMIMPMCSTNADMFENYPWNFTAFSEDCYKKWKVRVSRADLAILEYGGKDIESSNIIFSNGLLDPWSGAGVLRNLSKSVLAVIIPEAAHHLDLRSSNPNDPQSVINARKFHRRVIGYWLKDFYQKYQQMYYYY